MSRNRPTPVKKRRFGKHSVLIALCAVLILGASGAAAYVCYGTKTKIVTTPKTSTATKQQPTEQKDTIRLIATGDELPHDAVNQAAKTDSGYNYVPLFSKLQPYLTSADMSYCNQETPSDPSRAVSGYPTFNAPESFASALSQEGCTIINLANNHADDRGQSGIDATLDVWSNLKTQAVAGTNKTAEDQQKVATFTVKGVTFAFLSYTQCSNDTSVSSYGVNMFSQTLADQQIATARAQNVDMIIAAMHACDENTSQESTWQKQTAAYFAGKGVDIVIGTGPHWLQPVQRLDKAGGGKTVVWYSLGNLLSTQLETNGLIGGIATMDIDPETKTVTSIGFMPTYMHYEWTAAQKASSDLLARHNLMLYPLDRAAEPLSTSLLGTTVQEQTDRVTKLMNTYTNVTMYTSATFPK